MSSSWYFQPSFSSAKNLGQLNAPVQLYCQSPSSPLCFCIFFYCFNGALHPPDDWSISYQQAVSSSISFSHGSLLPFLPLQLLSFLVSCTPLVSAHSYLVIITPLHGNTLKRLLSWCSDSPIMALPVLKCSVASGPFLTHVSGYITVSSDCVRSRASLEMNKRYRILSLFILFYAFSFSKR